MYYKLKNHDILYNNAQLGPYPEQLLKRVEKPTTVFVNEPKRKGQRDNIAKVLREKAANGEYNEATNQRILNQKFGKKEPTAVAFTEIMLNCIVPIRDFLPAAADHKAPLPDDPRAVARHIKSFAYFCGADAVGICEVPEYAVFLDDPKGQPFENPYKYAIVMINRKDMRTTHASSGRDRVFDACSHQAYTQLAMMSFNLTNYIRHLGWDALASTCMNYVTVMPAMIIAAGLGEGGRMGLAVNPFFGPNFKSACVLTNLKMETDQPIDFGLQDYCSKCHICADACPCNAISADNEMVEYNGYLRWKMDYEKHSLLALVDSFTSSCGRCTNMCPWNRPKSRPEDFRDWDGSIEKLHAEVNEHASYLREHGLEREEHKTNQWWFDFMPDETGNLNISSTAEFEIPPCEHM